MTELSKYNKYYYQNMREYMEDDENDDLLSDDWDGDFRSQNEYRKMEIFVTLTFKNVKVKYLIKKINLRLD